MPADKSTQTPRKDQISDSNVKIITPLKVRGRGGQPDSPRSWRIPVITILFILFIASFSAGGFFFIRHLSKHPLNLPEDTDQIAPSKAGQYFKSITEVTPTTRQQAKTGEKLTPLPPGQQEIEPKQTIDPEKIVLEKERAEKKLAVNLDAVNRLIDSGKNHEENNRFAFSHADYQEALKLDPESREAQQALNRVKEKIVGEQFQKLMSEGLTAFHNGNYQSARTKLLEAKSFRTDSREVQEALEQVDEAVRLEKIEKLRRKAMAAELAEDWEQVLKSCLYVLKIDPNISFAVQGKERSIEQIRVAKRMSFFLQNPDALESNPQLQNAILLIAEAEKLQPRGPRLNVRLDELKDLADAARTPVKVMIESDNLTEVVVYKVGELGRFTFREISLRPGVYTVVGSRNGYKDVRQKIIVKHGRKALHVTVICTKKV